MCLYSLQFCDFSCIDEWYNHHRSFSWSHRSTKETSLLAVTPEQAWFIATAGPESPAGSLYSTMEQLAWASILPSHLYSSALRCLGLCASCHHLRPLAHTRLLVSVQFPALGNISKGTWPLETGFFPLRNLWLYIFLKGTPYLVFPLFTCCIVSDLLINLQCWVWNTEPWVCGANILPLSLTAPSPILISVLSGLYFPRVCPIIKSLGAETGSDICAAAQGGLSSQTPVN